MRRRVESPRPPKTNSAASVCKGAHVTTAFDRLARPIQKWVRSKGWRELREVQTRAIHAICGGDQDVIVAASTAGGKTEAAFLPLISQVLEEPAAVPGFDLLYIGPLKALITDQAMRLEGMCQDTGLAVVPWHGDVGASVKARALKAPGGILLITPESLEALFVRRGSKILRLFSATRAVVLDEMHTLLGSERGVQTRSLLTRLEHATGHRLRRIGLSATLGRDTEPAKRYLQPDHPARVHLIETVGETELRLQLRGYVTGEESEGTPSATDAIAEHLFRQLRGSDNLVFAGSRQSVEIYADRLRELCDAAHLPQEFYPHHGNLSRDHRDFVERRLKNPASPTTAICTSTLELGIDIGDVTCVAQIGAPYSVASTKQRLGRSGRREGQPEILRQYCVEARLDPKSSLVDRLRLGLVRSVAMIELLLAKEYEAPRPDALHLSTLVHQVLSVIAGRGGATAPFLHRLLCEVGPFRQVPVALFLDVLRAMGTARLIEQAGGGTLLLGAMGEKIVEHYSFYAVFQTPVEYRLVSGGRDLGTIPVENILAPGMMLVFSGRRWTVREVDAADRVIVVDPAKGGKPPRFGGEPGIIADRVIEKMREIFCSDYRPIYMDPTALDLLDEARKNHRLLGFDRSSVLRTGDRRFCLATGCGTIKNATLALALRSFGYEVDAHDGFLDMRAVPASPSLPEALSRLASGEEIDVFSGNPNLVFEKFHVWLSPELQRADALAARLDVAALPGLCGRLLADAQRAVQGALDPAAIPLTIPATISGIPSGDYRFIALDVETANSDSASICQIGIACVRADNVIETWAGYVDPGTDFSAFNTRLHGIGPDQVRGAPGFAQVIAALLPLLDRHKLIQHSDFDRQAILGACSAAGLEPPRWRWHDSARIARRAWPEFRGNGGHGLAHLKARLNLEFDHHDAGEDARAAALVVLQAEESTGMTVEHLMEV